MNLNFTPYKLSNDELQSLKLEYSLVIKGVNLASVDKNTSNNIPSNYGVYFWIMNYKNEKYKIYIGKTNSLKRRLNDYSINFQIHSPNDFKLQFFQNFISSHLENISLDLYFMECSKVDYTEKETNAVNVFKPMINEKAKVSIEMKNKMQQAFAAYYQETFLNKLST